MWIKWMGELIVVVVVVQMNGVMLFPFSLLTCRPCSSHASPPYSILSSRRTVSLTVVCLVPITENEQTPLFRVDLDRLIISLTHILPSVLPPTTPEFTHLTSQLICN